MVSLYHYALIVGEMIQFIVARRGRIYFRPSVSLPLSAMRMRNALRLSRRLRGTKIVIIVKYRSWTVDT